MNKYELEPNIYINEDASRILSGKMEELAAAYIRENDLSVGIDDLWNDSTAEAARSALDYASEHNEKFYADIFFDTLLNY